MAIRRISDLPYLFDVVEDADLSKCLIEVSYNPKGKVYQSFYIPVSKLIEKIAQKIADNARQDA